MFTVFFVFFGWFIGGFVSGISGFGAMMLALPVLTLGLDAMDAILTCCIVAGPCCMQLAWLYRSFVYWPDMKWLWLGCVPGCILGTITLMAIPAGWLQIGISLLICIFLIVQIFGGRATWTLPDSIAALLITGCASGFCNSSVSVVGVPMGIFVLLKHWDKDKARGTMAMFFLLSSLITILTQWLSGVYNSYLFQISAIGAIGCFIGQALGFRVGRHINQAVFVKFALCFLTCAAVMLFFKGIRA
ncbi:MAG: sulfite exporter TauE/SafE family protein [Mailhella sp.]|nr:sulfite exporter TauE/SafE family protein [Mailhella sp.]